MTLITLLLTILLPVLAQVDSTISLESNRAAVLRLNGDGAFASAYYDSAGDETLTIRAESADGTLDLVLELLGPDGRTIAYIDAQELDAPVISRVYAPHQNRYTVRVNTFNGEGSGDVSVTVTVEPPYTLTPETPSLQVALGANTGALVYIDGFDLTAPLTITASDPTGRLDARIDIINARVVLAAGDDHSGTDSALNRFDTRLTAQLREDGILQINDFLGRSGWLTVSIRP